MAGHTAEQKVEIKVIQAENAELKARLEALEKFILAEQALAQK